MNASMKPVVLLLTAALSGSQFAWAAAPDSRISEDVTVTPGRAISRADEAAISRAALRTLNRIADARAAIARKDEAAARDQLRQADTLLDIIQAALPTTQVREQIRLAQSKLQYDQTREVRPDLVPIYASLDEIEDFAAARADAGVKADVQALQKDAQALERKIGQGGDKAESDAALLWHRTRALAERALDYTATGWSRLRAGSELKKSLIEAKLYARYADIDAFVGSDPARAQTDLAEVTRYLEQARGVKEIAPDTAQRIADLQQALAAMRQPGKPLDRADLNALTLHIGQTLRSL